MNSRLFLLVALAAVLSVGSTQGKVAFKNQNALRTISSSMNEFAGNFYKNLAKIESGNFISSPLSVSMMLSMLTFGANGKTEEQLRSILGLPKDDALTKDGFTSLIDSLNSIKRAEFRLENKIFIDNNLQLEGDFERVIGDTFGSTVQPVDFSRVRAAARTINDWAAEITNNKIKDLFKPDDLQGATTVLANAVYFKGNWKKQFSKSLTKAQDFHVNERITKKVDMMAIKESFHSGRLPKNDATFIEIPYEREDSSGQISMFVIVPDEINGLQNVERTLHEVNFGALKGSTSKTQLYLPKFKVESKFNLEEILKQLGIQNVFENGADFSGITKTPMHISKVIQKAYINVDEKGSEAAAITGSIGVATIPEPPQPINIVKVDRPFVYAIVHGDDKTVIFQGHVTSPVA